MSWLGNSHRRILILSPHPDDGEIGCGGTLMKLGHDSQKTNFIMTFSDATATKKEAAQASRVLGIETIFGNYRHRRFEEDRQMLLDELVAIGKKIKPDVVFMPCLHDIHQDHRIVAAEGLRAFKGTTILGYDMPWNNIGTSNQMFVGLNELQIRLKWQAINKYKSQSHRLYMKSEFVFSLARIRGAQSGFDYAESFEVIRFVLK